MSTNSSAPSSPRTHKQVSTEESSTMSSEIKRPTTPPNVSQPPVSGTPMVNKATKHEPFSSKAPPREVRNINLGTEMSGCFSGIMSPNAFLDQYLGKKIPGEPTKKAIGNRLASIDTQLETSMYQPFITAIKPYLKDTMEIIDTHRFKDRSCDYLSPDLALYSTGCNKLPKNPSFSVMSTFIEFKSRASMDPFQDPNNYPEEDLPDGFQFERQDVKSRERRGQIGAYASAISGTQFRTRVISVSVTGPTARFIVWDRGGALVSAQFNYVEEPQYLVSFFYRYSRRSPEEQGIDATTVEATRRDVKSIPPDIENRMREANRDHKGWRKVMVPDRDDAAKQGGFLVSYPLSHTTPSPFSRSTRGMLAFDLAHKKLVFLKDYWRPDVDNIEKEGEIYRDLEKQKIPHIAPFGMGNDIKGHKTVTQAPNDEREDGILPTPRQTRLSHYRMTLNIVGKSLIDFKSSREFISAIADAMEAHDGAWFKCQILHRDISVGNIIIADNGEGILIDWDLCIKFPQRRPSQTEELQEATVGRRFARTGTWQFMSSHLLRTPTAIQDYCDDRESALWVLLWIAIKYTPTSGRPGPTSHHDLALLMNMFNDTAERTDGKIVGGSEKRSFLQNYSTEPISFTDRPVLHSLVATLTETFAVRYSHEPSARELAALEDVQTEMREGPKRDNALQNLFAYRYQQWMDNLNRDGWLVKTIRDHLSEPGWPLDDQHSRQDTLPLSSTPHKRGRDENTLETRLVKKHPHVPSGGSRSLAPVPQSKLRE